MPKDMHPVEKRKLRKSLSNTFGLGVFQKNCPTNKLSSGLTFTGKYGSTLAPQKYDSL